jgi:hypothetical protein
MLVGTFIISLPLASISGVATLTILLIVGSEIVR